MSRLLMCSLMALWTTSSYAAERPNVLLLLVDDLKPAFGAYGDDWVHSPNLDRLAARGMRFDKAYCNQAVCAPSRNNLMLGSRSTSIGVYSLGFHFRRAIPEAVTLPQYFMQNGYHSAGIGKVFHIGHGNINDELSWSVPFHPDKVVDYVLPESTNGQLTREQALFANKPANGLPRGAAWESADVDDGAYADGRIAAQAIKRLQHYQTDQMPFFLAVGFTKPHLPFCAPKKYWELYDRENMSLAEFTDKPEGAPDYARKLLGEINQYKPIEDANPIPIEQQKSLIHGYFAALSYMDSQLGRVIDELDRLKLSENTIIVLWGDHGYHLGDHGSWTKHDNYEQANRIPIVCVAPGVTQPNSSSDALVETVDILPSVIELAGLSPLEGPQPIDGTSFVPVLKSQKPTVDNHAYHCFPRGGRMGRAIRTSRYRMVEWTPQNNPDAMPDYELYDYQTDPLETKNLASEQPQVLEELIAILQTHPAALDKERNPLTPSSSKILTGPETRVANQDVRLTAEFHAPKPHGVLMALGGREQGMALHIDKGLPTFDVRIDGKVTRIQSDVAISKRNTLVAELTKSHMSLFVNDVLVAKVPSPGLLPAQPKDPLSVGEDVQSAAGDYESPNPFEGTILNTSIEVADTGN